MQLGRKVVYLGGDIILSINKIPVATIMDYLGALESTKPEETVEIQILRGNKEMNLSVKLSPRPKSFPW